jgi:hypothetical protein
MASLVTAIPQLVWISEHKLPLFAFAGVMLVISGVSTCRNRLLPCPTDPVQANLPARMAFRPRAPSFFPPSSTPLASISRSSPRGSHEGNECRRAYANPAHTRPRAAIHPDVPEMRPSKGRNDADERLPLLL